MKSADISTKPKAKFLELALDPFNRDCINPPNPKLSSWPIAAPLKTATSSGAIFSWMTFQSTPSCPRASPIPNMVI